MFTHPEILLDLTRQHQNELINEARSASLVRTARRGRAAGRRARRAAGGTQSHGDGSHPDWACLDQARPTAPVAGAAPAAGGNATVSDVRTTGPGGVGSGSAGPGSAGPGSAGSGSAAGNEAPEWSASAGSLVSCGVVGAEPAQ